MSRFKDPEGMSIGTAVVEIPERLVCLDAFVLNEAAAKPAHGTALLDWLQSNAVSVLLHHLIVCESLDSNRETDLAARQEFLERIPSLVFSEGTGIEVIDEEIAQFGNLGHTPSGNDIMRSLCAPVGLGTDRLNWAHRIRAVAHDALQADRAWNPAKVFHRANRLAEKPKSQRTIGEILDATGTSSTPHEIHARVARVDVPLGKGVALADRQIGMDDFAEFVRTRPFPDGQRWLNEVAERAFVPMDWFRSLTWSEFERHSSVWRRLPHAYDRVESDPGISFEDFCLRLNGLDPSSFRSLDVFSSVSNRYNDDPRRKLDASSTRDFWHICFSPHVPLLIADREMTEVFRQCRRKLSCPGLVLSGRVFWNSVFRSRSWTDLLSSRM